MKKSNLVPFVRENLDILFVGLNPADKSSDNGHYFSVKSSFWNQLFEAGLITKPVDKLIADKVIFGSSTQNFKYWNYGITDLVSEIAESNSRKVKVTLKECNRTIQLIKDVKPLTVVLLHSKVTESLSKYISSAFKVGANAGFLGKLLPESDTVFFNIAFPHGNSISDSLKIEKYRELKQYIIQHKKV